MKKSSRFIFLITILLCSSVSFAQRSNIANINTLQLWEMIPEKKKTDSTLLVLNKQYSEHYNRLSQEIEVLVLSYKGDTNSTPAIKADMAADIQNRQIRMENFKKEAESDLTKKREEMLAPIRKKMQDAIDKVALKNKYDYVLDSSYSNILYTKNKADDILELVKKELGL